MTNPGGRSRSGRTNRQPIAHASTISGSVAGTGTVLVWVATTKLAELPVVTRFDQRRNPCGSRFVAVNDHVTDSPTKDGIQPGSPQLSPKHNVGPLCPPVEEVPSHPVGTNV